MKTTGHASPRRIVGAEHGRRSVRQGTQAQVDYPPGFFTEPVRAWRQMRYDSAEVANKVREYLHNQENARRGREVALATGAGWGSGTMYMPNTPKTLAPGWMR
ncbi:MAG: hypothetical protein RL375_4837 [Pseudomonadota bacterium]|jgi:hypothetical protein